MSPRLLLVVTQGPDTGKRLAVDMNDRVIGRAREADLVLTDLAVSRRHLAVRVADGGVHVEVLSGTSSLVVDGRSCEHARLAVSERAVIGNTVLTVVDAAPAAADTEGSTDIRTVLDGLAVEIRGLSAVHRLVQALDQAQTREALDQEIARWANASVGAREARLLRSDDLPEALASSERGLVLERSDGEERVVTVPAHGGRPGALEVRLRSVTDLQRSLLVVAGQVVGSRMAHFDAQLADEAERRELRKLAVGSASAFLGSSEAAEQVSRLIGKLGASDATGLVLGESGTGKTFVARLIHEASHRAREPLRVVNCAALPEGLVESELFGHERGAFTGATSARIGAFEAAGRGTLLLDEIGELPLPSQAKLLRAIEERRFERVGSNRTLPFEARLLAATNRDLTEMVDSGEFRSDLFFRISVVTVRIAPLRERGDDVALIAKQLLADLTATSGRRITGIDEAALALVRAYPWPGNVRELRNALEHAIVLGDGPSIAPSDLPEAVRGGAPRSQPDDADLVRLPATLESLERRAIEAALRATSGNRTRAAALLGINRVTLYKKLREDPP